MFDYEITSKFSLGGFNFGEFGVSTWIGQIVGNPVFLIITVVGLYFLARLVFAK
ncbi:MULTISPECIES: hypothetical protein [unclassified Ruegeria]|uniref:hypothetical protein n=1 Tax=unclassified Ruegeria TaxID=2625375 RepID=UPI001ADA0803|nr:MULTISPECIES: hypothetical protein [unclassified Ruegeria]MBO9411448.1 hypothetical protein [Ruegeria sp. R8_1]MBO9415990.1 hypothetical protein [Ruegeria sp. R8_2]